MIDKVIGFAIPDLCEDDRVRRSKPMTANAQKLFDDFNLHILSYKKIIADDHIKYYRDKQCVSDIQMGILCLIRLSILVRVKYEIWCKLNAFLGKPIGLMEKMKKKIPEFIVQIQHRIESEKPYDVAVRKMAITLRDELIATEKIFNL